MNNYDLIKMIGQGSYGDVNLVSCHNDPKLYVMKVIRNANEEEGKEAMKEVNILETLDHPNIVKLKECFYQNSGKTLCIVMEYAESGDLYQQIQKAQKKRQVLHLVSTQYEPLLHQPIGHSGLVCSALPCLEILA
ncbi:unnamed protein product [Heterosigma akashiwo]